VEVIEGDGFALSSREGTGRESMIPSDSTPQAGRKTLRHSRLQVRLRWFDAQLPGDLLQRSALQLRREFIGQRRGLGVHGGSGSWRGIAH
jgi:hypothetical protein